MSAVLESLIAQMSHEKRQLLAQMLQGDREPLAVVGIGCRFPGGVTSADSFWHLLQNGLDGRVEVPQDRWDMESFYDPDPAVADKSYVRVGGFLPDLSHFDADFFNISPREALRMDPQQRLLLQTTWEALEDAGHAGETALFTPVKPAVSTTGVFVGMTNNQHILRQIMADADFYQDPFAGIGSDCSAAAGRLAYTFDFRGPTISLDTACSSSLVALHLACQSLRHKECDRAIVGGVYAIMLPHTFIVGCRMGMLSADGRCKTFDARADGYGLGEGCGVVVVKRLADALADNDTVRAIIRGTAVNEDGRSNGLTAPNGLAQQDVIRRALANANVAPHLIGYVEAHGTGTPLGDPIEVEAVQAVLENGRLPQHPLLIGSVKTNLGHLYTAAGMAGFIKTVLALQHQAIPQNLNFEQPNDNIAWNDGLHIPARLTPWQPIEGRRLAGVSSFGWSGTNAHVIVEEAAIRIADDPRRSWFLLPLSARTPQALQTVTADLQKHLTENPHLSIADVAYTLQTGRHHFGQRRVFVCNNRAEAVQALADDPTIRRFDNAAPELAPGVAFLFTGVGDQYANMGRDLYEQESAFREMVDRCCDYLLPLLGVNLRQLLYPDDAKGMGNGAAASADMRQMMKVRNSTTVASSPVKTTSELSQTEFAQPAVFVVNYALAHLLQTWGIEPVALLGHSLGEYVAACVAGVFSLEDALTLVARRAQLIQSLPPGRMLAVALGEEEIRPFLSPNISLAIHNGAAMCTLAGDTAAIEQLAATLGQREIACRLLDTSHAFHSPMMATAAAPLTALVQTISLHPPRIPYLSNVTGDWISAAQATDPGYWAQHMCQPVRFYDSVSQLLKQPDQLVVEIGAGQSLSSFVRQHPCCSRDTMQKLLTTLPALYVHRSPMAALLETLGKLWLWGALPNWLGLYAADEHRQSTSLPTYPFEGERFWVGPALRQFADEQTAVNAKSAPIATPTQAASLPRLPIDDWFYLPGWQQSAPHAPSVDTALDGWIIFMDESGVGAQLAHWLRAQAQPMLTVHAGPGWQRVGDSEYSIRPFHRPDYDTLLDIVTQRGWRQLHIVHGWSVDSFDGIQATLERGFYSLVSLAQSLHTHDIESCALSVLSTNIHGVIGDEAICPEKATIIGPCQSIPLEYEFINCRLIDVALPPTADWQIAPLWSNLLGELTADFSEPMVALRRHHRWRQTFTPLNLPPAPARPFLLRAHGTYLITGGLGGVGLAVAYYLAQTVQANVALLSRSPLPPRSTWPQLLATSANNDMCRKIQQIEQLEALGVSVLPLAADVTDADQMDTAVAHILAHFGSLDGVFHAAGVPGSGLIQLKTVETAAAVLAPKVQGTQVLEQVLTARAITPDFLLLFSSIASFAPAGPGQVDYCAANAFLDAYAQSKVGQRPLTAVINWGEWQWNSWQETLTDLSAEMQHFFNQNRAQFGLSFAEGSAALGRILARPLPQTVVATQEFSQLVQAARQLTVAALLQPRSEAAPPQHQRPLLSSTYVAPRTEPECRIAALWEVALGVSGIGIDDNFFDLGGNSLIGLMLVKQMQQALQLAHIPNRILYEAPTIRTLAQALDAKQPFTDMLIDQQHARGQKRQQQYLARRQEKKLRYG